MHTRLYIHIPFCRHKCPYCAFVSQAGNDQQISNYVDLLCVEMELASQLNSFPSPLDSVYLGGGTPSLLSPHQIQRLLDRANHLFSLAHDTEITLEANPGTVNPEHLRGFRNAGINRLSLGVQSFDEQLLVTLGRIHTSGQAQQAYEQARQAGFSNIGIDLIHSLPGQSLLQWQSDLERALQLAPEHLSVYGLTIEEDTPFAHRYPDETTLPDEDLSAAMYEMADRLLTTGGYDHYEIANYARSGRRSRHNSGYWKRDCYLGVGVGAHSFLPDSVYGIRFSNTPELDVYSTAIKNARLPRQDVHHLTRTDAMSEYMFLGLRMTDGVCTDDFARTFSVDVQDMFAQPLEELITLGLLMHDSTRIRLTARGLLLSNQVFSRFLLE